MNFPEEKIRKKCQKLVEELSFYLLTKPRDWRYRRDTNWEVGQANSLKSFTKRNAAWLFNKMQDSDYTQHFAEADHHDDYVSYAAQKEICEVLYTMFPTMGCLYADDLSDIEEKFRPRLRKIRAMFS